MPRCSLRVPRWSKATTGEEVTAIDLGGAMAHNQKSGVAHFVAESDENCIDQIKTLLSLLTIQPSGKTARRCLLGSVGPDGSKIK